MLTGKMMAEKESLRYYVLKTALDRYGTEPEYPWKSAPDYCVLRYSNNKKWYGLTMYVRRQQLGLDGEEYVDVLNVKCEAADHGMAGFCKPEILRYRKCI